MAKLEDGSQTTQIPQASTPPVLATDSIVQPQIIEITDEVPASVSEGDAKKDDTISNKDTNQEEGSTKVVEEKLASQAITNIVPEENVNSPLRRGSQESTATTTTQTTTTTGSDSTDSSTDSSSTDSTSSDSDDSSSEDDANKVRTQTVFSGKLVLKLTFNFQDPNSPLSDSAVEKIYKSCIKNLEECITRFPEHYKSIYRLVLIYMNGPERVKDVEKCRQLLMGTYTTALTIQIQGLFSDRKNSNLFNVRTPEIENRKIGFTKLFEFAGYLAQSII